MKYLNHIVYYLLLIASYSPVYASANIDSLLQVIEVHQAQANNLKLIESYFQLGDAYLENEQSQEALETYHLALEKSEEIGLKEQIAYAHSNMGKVYQKLKQFETALNELQEALTIGKGLLPEIKEMGIYAKLSDSYLAMGNTDEAYDYQLRILRYWEEKDNLANIANSYYQIASIYFTQRNFEEALHYYEKSLELEQQLNVEERIVKSLAAIASVYGRLGQYDKSLQKNFEALRLAEEKDYKNGIAYASHNISADYLSMKKTDEAAPYIKKALKLRRELGDKFGENTSLQAQGYMNMLLGNHDQAIKSIKQALAIAQDINDKPLIRDSHMMLSQVYSRAEEWEKSFESYRVFAAYKDSMVNEASNQKMTQLQIKYEIQKKEKEKEIALLKKDKQIAALYRYGVIGGLMFLLFIVSLLLLFVFYRYKNQAAVNSILTEKSMKIQLKNAQLARSNRDLEQFAYIASHDLKEPLRNIGGFITLLNRKCGHYQDEEAKDYMQFITNSVDHMHHLLTDLLAYSRIGIVARSYEQVNMETVVQTVKTSFKSYIEEQNARISICNMPNKIFANRTQMVQLIQNLVGNALKFRSNKTPQVNIECIELPDRYVFSVKDNGIGMQQEYTDKIFVIFQRLHNRTEYDGTGIGLSICKKIVEQHEGEIWVESQSGKGSTFYFSISKQLSEKDTVSQINKTLVAA